MVCVLSLFFVFPGIGQIGRTCFPFTVEYILTSTAALHYSVIFYQIKLCEHGLGGALFFGVAWLVNSFEVRKVVLWLLETCLQSRTGWCCVVSTRLKPRGLAKPLRVSPLHV